MSNSDERARTDGDAGSDAAEPTETYTHRPGATDDPAAAERGGDQSASDLHGADPDAVDREFGWRGYVLLGVLFVAFVVAPLVVYLRPPQLGWRVTLILFPLLPAVALGFAAIWATTRP